MTLLHGVGYELLQLKFITNSRKCFITRMKNKTTTYRQLQILTHPHPPPKKKKHLKIQINEFETEFTRKLTTD
jgi:hypothetical protein